MSYTPVNDGGSIQSTNGDVMVTVSLDRPLYSDQRLSLIRDVPRFQGDSNKTPYEWIQQSVDGQLDYVFVATGESLFGSDAGGLDQDTQMTFTPRITNSDGSLVEVVGNIFSITVQPFVVPEPPIDVPITDNLLFFWDARYRVVLPTDDASNDGSGTNGQWLDRASNRGIDLLPNNGQSLEFSPGHNGDPPSHFKVRNLAITKIGETAEGAIGHLPVPIALPTQWTMFIIGYSGHNDSYDDVPSGQNADALFGYQTDTGNGPYEGIYKKAGSGLTGGSSGMNLTHDMALAGSYAIRSWPGGNIVNVWIDGAAQGGVAFNTATVGNATLSSLFPAGPFVNNDYRLGAILIYEGLLDDDQISDLTNYANNVWYLGAS